VPYRPLLASPRPPTRPTETTSVQAARIHSHTCVEILLLRPYARARKSSRGNVAVRVGTGAGATRLVALGCTPARERKACFLARLPGPTRRVCPERVHQGVGGGGDRQEGHFFLFLRNVETRHGLEREAHNRPQTADRTPQTAAHANTRQSSAPPESSHTHTQTRFATLQSDAPLSRKPPGRCSVRLGRFSDCSAHA